MVEIIIGTIIRTIYDKEDNWFKPDDVNPESDKTEDGAQKPLMIPLIESSK